MISAKFACPLSQKVFRHGVRAVNDYADLVLAYLTQLLGHGVYAVNDYADFVLAY